jgi:hypothetical protein
VGIESACDALGVARASFYRQGVWANAAGARDRSTGARAGVESGIPINPWKNQNQPGRFPCQRGKVSGERQDGHYVGPESYPADPANGILTPCAVCFRS